MRQAKIWRSEVDWGACVGPLCRAERALALFDGECRHSPAYAVFGRDRMLREAVADAALTGQSTTPARLSLVLDGSSYWRLTEGDVRAQRIYQALSMAYSYGGRPRDISAAATDLTAADQNAVIEIDEAVGVLFARGEQRECVSSLVQVLHELWDDRDFCALPLIAKAALAGQSAAETAARYGSVNPGRLARLISSITMRSRSRSKVPALLLSEAYYAKYGRGDIPDDAGLWVRAVADMIAKSCHGEREKLRRVALHLARAADAGQTKRGDSRLFEVAAIIACLCAASVDQIATAAARRRAITRRGVLKIVSELKDLGLCVEVTGRSSYRLFSLASFASDLDRGEDEWVSACVRQSDNFVKNGDADWSVPLDNQARVMEFDDETVQDLYDNVDDVSRRVEALLDRFGR